MTATVEILASPTSDDLDDLVALIGLLGHSLDAEVLSARLSHLLSLIHI